MTAAQLLVEQIQGTRDWTLKLLADFQGAEWGFQPQPGLAHATWIVGHLASSQNVLLFRRCLGRSEMDDGFAAHFPIGGPVPSVGEHAYPSISEIRKQFDRMQELTLSAVAGLSDGKLAEAAFGAEGKPHPHYGTVAGAISHMARHEAFHAGQLAMIRRLLGKSFLR